MWTFHPTFKAAAIGAAISTTTPFALAQSFDAVRLPTLEAGMNLGTVGLGVMTSAKYMGSDERRTMLAPILDYQWCNGWFAGTSNGVGYNFGATPGLQFGPRVTVDLGRKANRAAALRGMDDIQAKAELGAFLNYALLREVMLTSTLRYGAGNESAGLLSDLGINFEHDLAPAWHLSLRAAVSIANADYMQSYFGVTPAQAASSGYAAYKPSAGIRDTRSHIALAYRLDRSTFFTAAVSSSSLANEANSSPLTRKRTSVTSLIAIGYSF